MKPFVEKSDWRNMMSRALKAYMIGTDIEELTLPQELLEAASEKELIMLIDDGRIVLKLVKPEAW